MNNLGLSLSQAGDYASAEPFFQQTVFATELARGKSDPELAFALSNLGVLLVVKGQLDAADPVLRRGLAIREASLGPRDLRTASSLTDLASALLRRGDDAGAEPLLLRARQIFEGAGAGLPPPPARAGERPTVTAGLLGRPGLASVLLNLSTLELHRGHVDAGKALADQVLQMQRQALGPRHPDVATALTALGHAELAANDYVSAAGHFTQAIDMLQAALGDTHPALVDPLGGLAGTSAAQQNRSKAVEAYQRAIAIRRSHFGAADTRRRRSLGSRSCNGCVMDDKGLLGAIAHVNSIWSIAAFAIAAVVAVLKVTVASPNGARRKGKSAPPALSHAIVWPIVTVICLLGALPIVANTFLESRRIQQQSLFRVRVTVLDPQGNPISGVTLRTTASNETTATADGAGVVTIPAGALPADRKVTIFADLESAFLHGRTNVQLADDPNPSVTIEIKSNRDAAVAGVVEDEQGRAIAAATVHVIGGDSGETSATGSFTLKANAAVGQTVRLHAEKKGYKPVDQDHPAGREPATLVLAREPATPRR